MVDVSRMTPLHVVADNPVENNIAIDIVSALRANNTAKNSKARCSQHLAVHLEDDYIVYVLNKQNYKGNTALHLASEKKQQRGHLFTVTYGCQSGSHEE